jgi:hypothetical protein
MQAIISVAAKMATSREAQFQVHHWAVSPQTNGAIFGIASVRLSRQLLGPLP